VATEAKRAVACEFVEEVPVDEVIALKSEEGGFGNGMDNEPYRRELILSDKGRLNRANYHSR